MASKRKVAASQSQRPRQNAVLLHHSVTPPPSTTDWRRRSFLYRLHSRLCASILSPPSPMEALVMELLIDGSWLLLLENT